MKKYLKILAYIGGIAGATALGSIFGGAWGFVAFGSSFLVGASVFVMTDGVNLFYNKSKDKTSRFNANMKDDETYDMEETLGEYKGTYLSNVKGKDGGKKSALPPKEEVMRDYAEYTEQNAYPKETGKDPTLQYVEDLKAGKRKPEISPNVSYSRVTDQELKEDDEKLMDFLKSEQLDRIMTDIESEKKNSTSENPNETKNYHSKFAPASQGVKSRKPIEDDFEFGL